MTEALSKSDHLGGVLSLVVSYVKQLEAAVANFTATLASTEAELTSRHLRERIA